LITCIAVDDEPMALEVIGRYCSKSDLVDLKAVFREPVKAVEYLGLEKVDLVFLDINMPDLSGMQLLQTLSPRPMVIFTTAYSHYAVESYTLHAVDYLLKPITFERFLAAVNKAVASVAVALGEPPALFIKSGPQTYQVRVRDILFLEKEGNYITVHLADRDILVRENMVDVFDLVPAADFVRVHKSFVVAIRHITTIEVHQVTVAGVKIPIGSTYREALRSRLGLDKLL
jgi:DNA-binding LytR/AlgR family response regulator